MSIDLAAWYDRAGPVVDGFVYLILFTAIARVALGDTARGRAGHALAGAVGFALAVGAATLAHSTGFRLSSLGLMAWGLVLIVLAITVQRSLAFFGAPWWLSVSGSLVLTLGLTGTLAESVMDALAEAGLGAVIPIAFVVFATALVIGLVRSREVRRDPTSDRFVPEPVLPIRRNPDGDGFERLRGGLNTGSFDARSETALMGVLKERKKFDADVMRDAQRLSRSVPDSKRKQGRALIAAITENGQQYQRAFDSLAEAHDHNDRGAARLSLRRLQQIQREANRLRAVLSRFVRRHR
ncbi:MAG: hypothetical protein ED559_06155 [Phycisphaera sp.]|nr:MAG: hypothetical protein ED559_06155 [Phycisphaera sp.]